MNPVTVLSSIHKDLRQTYDLPIPVIFCVKSISMIHWIWWLGRKKGMVKPENILPAALGTGLDFALKLTPQIVEKSVRMFAKIILVATRVDECREKMQSLAKGFTRLKEAFLGKHSEFIEPQWIKTPRSILFSATTLNDWSLGLKKFTSYIKRIYHCIIRLFVKIFKLAMHLWDTYHAIVLSHDDVPELFVNGLRLLKKVRENKDFFYQKLEDYEPLIQKIFDSTEVPATMTAHRFIKKAKTVFDTFDTGLQTIEHVNNFVGETVVDHTKKVIDYVKYQFLNMHSKKLYQGLQKEAKCTPFTLNELAITA